jgi:hypothetical protein
MIVLLQTASDSVVVTLTTSKDKVPFFHKGKRCVADDVNGVHFYFLPKDFKVGKNGFAFAEDTWIQVHRNLVTKSIKDLEQKYVVTNEASMICELLDDEYFNLLLCISKSKFTPRGIKRDIIPVLEKFKKRRPIN